MLLVACSTKRNTFLSRNSHALSTEYNILYNGGLALDAGLAELQLSPDNFWERLPVERMQPAPDAMNPGQTRNANFERAETKAIKAIQKHSMNIGGSEKNPQMDEAHLMLGKARYYDNRFVPALEAFNYILYKYPTSDKIYEAKVWREKANIRMENDQLAVSNLRKLLSEIKFKDQVFADANAILAEAFLNLEQPDSAVAKLKLATEFTKKDEEKARYRFILGQLYEEQGHKDSAHAVFQEIIDMKRKSPRQYVVQAHARQALQFDHKTGDTTLFVKKFQKLLDDRENRPYLGTLNHQMALFYERLDDDKNAVKYYNASLKHKNENGYLVASNYRNLADINFDNAKYVVAGQYYDSTLTQLNSRSREYKAIRRKRDNLEDVIKYEGIATANDSILDVVAMDLPARRKYYEDYIEKLKKDDERKRALAEKLAQEAENVRAGADSRSAVLSENVPKGDATTGRGVSGGRTPGPNMSTTQSGAGGAQSDFYFYNPSTVAFGKTEFRKYWGGRAHVHNWRIAAKIAGNNAMASADGPIAEAGKDSAALAVTDELRYSADFYLDQVPTDRKVLDSLARERNFAYYQLGVIYKEKFREYERAAEKLENLLISNPEERLVLPSMYNLYKIYEITNPVKATEMKGRITSQFPESRYAQILNSAAAGSDAAQAPEVAYEALYKQFLAGDYRNVLQLSQQATEQYTGDEIVSKFELLKAHTIGKLRGIDEYRKALNFVALNYPSSAEGKQAEALLAKEIPALASLQFSKAESSSWKILYRAKSPDAPNVKNMLEKIRKFTTDRKIDRLTTSFDIYTETDNFVVIHGMRSEDLAKNIATILKEVKEYKIPDEAIIISGQNYEVVQIKKNLDEYLANPSLSDVSVTDQLPFTPPVKQVTSPTPRGAAGPRDNAVPDTRQNPGAAPVKPGAQQQMPTRQTPDRNPQKPGNPNQQALPPGQFGGPPPAPQMQQPKR